MPFGDLPSNQPIPASYATSGSSLPSPVQAEGTGTVKVGASQGYNYDTWITICSTTISAGTWVILGRATLGYNSDGYVNGTLQMTANGSAITYGYWWQNEYDADSNVQSQMGEPYSMATKITVAGNTTIALQIRYTNGSSGASFTGNDTSGSEYGKSKILAFPVAASSSGGTTNLGDIAPSTTSIQVASSTGSSTSIGSRSISGSNTLATLPSLGEPTLQIGWANVSHGTYESSINAYLDNSVSYWNANKCTGTSSGSVALCGLGSGSTTLSTYSSASNPYCYSGDLITVGLGSSGGSTLGNAPSGQPPSKSIFGSSGSYVSDFSSGGGVATTIPSTGTYVVVGFMSVSLPRNANARWWLYKGGNAVDKTSAACGNTTDASLAANGMLFDTGTYSAGSTISLGLYSYSGAISVFSSGIVAFKV